MFLFLVENRNQLQKANSTLKILPTSSKCALFPFNRNAPFFFDAPDLKDSLSSWEKYGFDKMPNNRFWLHNYNSLTNCLSHVRSKSNDADIVYNKYFCMDLHWKIGNNYIQPLFHFKKFLEKEKVSKVCLKLMKDFISDSIKGICDSLKIETTHIFDHKY